MLKNYLTSAIRHFRKQKVISIINITGLTIGITCTILITLFIKDEFSYDRFHENLDSIYRPFIRFHNPDGSVDWQGSSVHLPHGPALKEYFPEVKRSVRVWPWELVLKLGDLIENQEITLADAEFFEMFSFPLIQGNAAKVLSDFSSVVISESFAKKYFRGKDPIGKTITLISGNYRNDFIVAGVAQDPPPNSTITFNLLINFESIRLFGRAEDLTNWGGLWTRCKTYIELKDRASAKTVETRYSEFARKYYAARFERERNAEFKNAAENIDPISFGLQRIKDAHLDPTSSGSRNLTSVYILGGIALIILFIAGINFVTISIGNASSRFIEVGIRKVVGAERRQLIRQCWNESMILTGFALILGVGTADMFLPAFNRLALKSLQISAVISPMILGFLVLMTLIIGLFVGSYPALFLSRFHPVDIFKRRVKLRGRNFSPEMPTDHQAVIVNETLVKKLNIADPIGKTIELYGNLFPIMGVVSDYHLQTKRYDIHPAIHLLDPTHNYYFMMVRFSPSDISEVLAKTQSAWKELQLNKPLSYSFLDEDVEAQYVQEKRWNRIVGYSSVMAVLIACLGIFGLTLLTVCRRTKEIGIRKVCGASVFSILKLLSLESAGWVLISNLIAWPAAWYVMHRWLQNFAYKIHLSPVVFLMAAFAMLLVVLLTTCIQSWKAARSNPVEALRYE